MNTKDLILNKITKAIDNAKCKHESEIYEKLETFISPLLYNHYTWQKMDNDFCESCANWSLTVGQELEIKISTEDPLIKLRVKDHNEVLEVNYRGNYRFYCNKYNIIILHSDIVLWRAL